MIFRAINGVFVIDAFSLFCSKQAAEFMLLIGKADIQEKMLEIFVRFVAVGNWPALYELFDFVPNLQTALLADNPSLV